MKPLTANDLVLGGKYVIKWLGDEYIVTYHGCRENEYNFVSEKTKFFMPEKDIHHITPYHEPNETTMNTDYTEQPFNLETALKHPDWVYFRNGEKPLEWHWFEKAAKDNFPLIAINKSGGKISNTKYGFFDISELPNGYNLILRVPYQTVFVVLQSNGDAKWYKNEGLANNIVNSGNGIACVPVKIPVV
jgi:hypothetical protein